MKYILITETDTDYDINTNINKEEAGLLLQSIGAWLNSEMIRGCE